MVDAKVACRRWKALMIWLCCEIVMMGRMDGGFLGVDAERIYVHRKHFVVDTVPEANEKRVRSGLNEIGLVLNCSLFEHGTISPGKHAVHGLEVIRKRDGKVVAYGNFMDLDIRIEDETGEDQEDVSLAQGSSCVGKIVHLYVKLPRGLDLGYNMTYTVHVHENSLAEIDWPVQWSFQTELAPISSSDLPSADTKVNADVISVYGLGVYVLDLGEVDIRSGRFDALFQLFLLEYYRKFEDVETAIREAMNEDRSCKDVEHGEKFRFLQNVTESELLQLITFINLATRPRVETAFDLETGKIFDHFLVQSTFTFSPTILNYPFDPQELPLVMELSGQSVSISPDVVICSLDRFSGFAKDLSSLQASKLFPSLQDSPILLAQYEIGESNYWPPVETQGNGSNPRLFREYQFPHNRRTSRQPSRYSSRLRFVIHQKPPSLLGVLYIAPSIFIAASAMLTYALPMAEYRSKLSACTSSLLAAVVQHSSQRAVLPQRAAISNADILMLVVYFVIILALMSGVVGALSTQRMFKPHIGFMKTVSRGMGFASPILLAVFWPGLGGPRTLKAWFLVSLLFVLLVVLYVRGCSTKVCENVIAKIWGGSHVHDRRTYRPVDLTEPSLPSSKKLSPNDVAAVIEQLDSSGLPRSSLEKYADRFLEEKIDGNALKYLNVKMIHSSLRIPLGHSVVLFQALQDLSLVLENKDHPKDVVEEGNEGAGYDYNTHEVDLM